MRYESRKGRTGDRGVEVRVARSVSGSKESSKTMHVWKHKREFARLDAN